MGTVVLVVDAKQAKSAAYYQGHGVHSVPESTAPPVLALCERIPPCEQPLKRSQIPFWSGKCRNEMRKSHGHELFKGGALVQTVSHCDAPCNLRRISPYLCAPVVQYRRLVFELLRCAKVVPFIYVLRHNSQRHFLTTAPKYDWYLAKWRRIQFQPTRLDNLQVSLKVQQTGSDGAKNIPVFVKVATMPAGTHSQDISAARKMVDGSSHVS